MVIEPQPQDGVASNRAWNFDDYSLGGRKKRLVIPRQIGGTTRNAFVVIGHDFASFSVNPMTSFNFGFDELLPERVARSIMQAFHELVTIGLDPTDILWIGALHEKQSDGKPSTDMHAGYINRLLKPEVRWNPYVEKKDRALFTAFTELVNFQFELSSPKDSARQKLASSPPAPRDPAWVKKWKQMLTEETERRAREQQFTSRNEFLDFLKTLEGVSQAWIDKKVIRAEVRGRVLPVMGVLATEWYYEDPNQFKRKTREEYVQDLEKGLEARKKAHERLYTSSGRNPVLSWIRFFEISLPEELKAKSQVSELDRSKDRIHRILGVGKYAKSADLAAQATPLSLAASSENEEKTTESYVEQTAVLNSAVEDRTRNLQADDNTSDLEPLRPEATSTHIPQIAVEKAPHIPSSIADLHSVMRHSDRLSLQELFLELERLGYLKIDEDADNEHKLKIRDCFRRTAEHLYDFKELEDTVDAANAKIRDILNEDRNPEFEMER